MKKIRWATVILMLTITWPTPAQTIAVLRQKLNAIVSKKNAHVGISISGDDGKDTLSIHGDEHFPMQSVFKFHIALKVLSEIDKGRFSLDQKIELKEHELLPGLHSPIRETYPKGASLTIAEILEYTVSKSDNVGCDVLLRLVGGPQAVEEYFTKNNFRNLSIKINEEVMQGDWDLQFLNWTTPRSATEILASFYKNERKLISEKSHEFIWTTMRQTETGKARLKGLLPAGTVVAHKTGWSGVNKDGISAAVNDIGIVFLPNGRYFFISVFITRSKEDTATSEKIIADVAKATWDYFISKSN